jgi:hypothetical protein
MLPQEQAGHPVVTPAGGVQAEVVPPEDEFAPLVGFEHRADVESPIDVDLAVFLEANEGNQLPIRDHSAARLRGAGEGAQARRRRAAASTPRTPPPSRVSEAGSGTATATSLWIT